MIRSLLINFPPRCRCFSSVNQCLPTAAWFPTKIGALVQDDLDGPWSLDCVYNSIIGCRQRDTSSLRWTIRGWKYWRKVIRNISTESYQCMTRCVLCTSPWAEDLSVVTVAHLALPIRGLRAAGFYQLLTDLCGCSRITMLTRFLSINLVLTMYETRTGWFRFT